MTPLSLFNISNRSFVYYSSNCKPDISNYQRQFVYFLKKNVYRRPMTPLQPSANDLPLETNMLEPSPCSRTRSDHLQDTKASQSSPCEIHASDRLPWCSCGVRERVCALCVCVCVCVCNVQRERERACARTRAKPHPEIQGRLRCVAQLRRLLVVDCGHD
jgi:hypothetical protein